MQVKQKGLAFSSALLAGLILAGCSGTSLNRAPVDDRSGSVSSSNPLANQPGYYTVRQGDTLIRIGLENGQSWKDIASWNQLVNADVIEVGQVLRVAPPGSVVSASAGGSAVVTQPISSGQVQPVTSGSSASSSSSASAAASASANTNTSGLAFVWPANGPLLAGFNEATNKGYDIGGNAGDPVVAAAGGRVVYAGAGLRGYGNLIILKHNDQYLTAYAHNRALLVKEDQTVTKGQKIAEMGNTDADRVKLHFEVRRQGKPVNPAGYLPRR